MIHGVRVLLTCKKRGWNGETAMIQMLCRGLLSEGHEVTIGAQRGSALESRLAGHGARVVPLNLVHAPIALRSLAQDLGRIRRLLRQVDVVHTHASWDTWLVAWSRSIGACPIPLVRTRHNLKAIKNHAFNRWLYRSSVTRTVAVSRAVAADLRRQSIVKERRLRVVLNGIDEDTFDPRRLDVLFARRKLRRQLGAPPEGLVVASLARVVPGKQPEVFVEAALRLLRKGVRAWFVLAGEMGGTPSWQRSLQAKLEGSPRVQHVGFVENVAELLAGADVFVSASTNEAFGLAPVEAMAMGCVPVCAAAGGMREVVQDGATGLLFVPGAVDQCAARIEELLANRGLREALACRGRVDARHRFGSRRMVADYVALYRSLVDRRTSAAPRLSKRLTTRSVLRGTGSST